MAEPQIENGYTKIANEILEVLAKQPLNGTQRRILDVVFRYTYGFNRKEHELSLSYISKASNMHKQQVKRELDDLILKGIIHIVSEASFKSSRVIEFNKNYDMWIVDSKQNRVQLANQSTLQSANQSTPTVSGLEYQERKSLKKILNKDTYTPDFEKFYSLYPRAEEKRRTFKNWKACLKDHKPEVIIQAGMNYKDKVTQAGTEKQFMKTSANFLGRDKFYQDYINSETQAANKYADVKI